MRKRLTGLIEKVKERIDKIKYYNGVMENPLEFLEELERELEDIDSMLPDENCIYDEDDLEDSKELGKRIGYEQAMSLVVKNVLQNAKLKSRGDMIDAVERLELK